MIKTKADYHYYLEQDKIALGISANSNLKKFFTTHYIYKFQRLLRKLEYYNNCKTNIFNKIIFYVLRSRYERYSLKLGFSIPLNVFGPGLAIVHYGTLIVSNKAVIGKNCRIHPGVSIGESGGKVGAPIMGDNVYIGPGAKIFGAITIGNNVAISANSTVFKSYVENDILIAGNPAERIKSIDIKNIIKHI